MQANTLLEITHQALILVLLLSLPAVITAAVVGLGAGIVQAVTSIQDQSIPQSLKLVVVLVVLLLTARWMGVQIFAFADGIFRNFAVFYS